MSTYTHDNVEINPPIETWTWGSARVGELDLNYYDLVEALGEPEQCDGYKVDAEWRIRWPDGMIATVYNYKSRHNYYGDEGTDTDKIRDWHISGMPQEGTPDARSVVDRVLDLVTSRLDHPFRGPHEIPDQSTDELPERPTLVVWLTETQRARLLTATLDHHDHDLSELLAELEIDVVTTEYVNAVTREVSFRAKILDRLTSEEWYASLAPRHVYENQWVPMRWQNRTVLGDPEQVWGRDWDREPEDLTPDEVEVLTKVARASRQPHRPDLDYPENPQ